MVNRKPNVLLTVAIILMVIAAFVCLIVFLSSAGARHNETLDSGPQTTTPSDTPTDTASSTDTDETEPSDTEPVVAPAYDAEKLQADLKECLTGPDSTWQVVLIDLEDGATFTASTHCNQNDLMVAADLTKLFVMATAYDKVNSGELTLEQISSLVTKMIREDSASAANDLTKLIGGGDAKKGREEVNNFATSIGCFNVEFNRLFGETGPQNYITATDCANLLLLIARGECVSEEASNSMLEVLTGTDGERIPGGVPEGTTVAHLNANITGTCCADVGIVFTESHNFVLAIICNDPITNEGSTRKCVEITKLAYEYLG